MKEKMIASALPIGAIVLTLSLSIIALLVGSEFWFLVVLIPGLLTVFIFAAVVAGSETDQSDSRKSIKTKTELLINHDRDRGYYESD